MCFTILPTTATAYLFDDNEGSRSNVKGFALSLENGNQFCTPRIPLWLIVIMCSGMPE